ncbi:hypothetical protein RHSIM_Rhsim03G0053800 [Rhododendron simsii]|uniref:SHSP domain-containing protein n=1 Tax=Rhododendron simsii TaxID=118357 RepID=A0A834LP14_RHOSS|nr:hypothetical protein RHSIM_Rhsim03G0053800 [Rhododendron simsii]
MQTMNGSSLSYEDFEPFCNWRHNDESETLVIHLPAFRKDQLKIQVFNTTNTVKISGERLVDATKRSRFHKEIAIPKDCKSKEILAKFAGGQLHVVIPKKGPPAPQQQLISTTILRPDYNNETQMCDSRSKSLLKMATNVAAMVALGACLGAYIIKDQLKIQVFNTTNTVKISGERLVDATKRSRFHKEIAIPKDCKSKEILAKFAGGQLHVVIPKKGPPAPQQQLISTTILRPDYNNEIQMCDSRLKSLLKMATNVAAMVALGACLGAYIMYSYRSLYIED